MAEIRFTGLCGGTVKKKSKKGSDYSITQFTDLSGSQMSTFEVFGELGLVRDMTPREYFLDAKIVSLGNVQVLAGMSPVPTKSK